MKQLHTIVLIVLAALSSSLANAQEFSEYPSSRKGEDGKTIRSGFITNKWYDNWDISLGVGVSAVTAKGNGMMLSPDFEIDLTKWAMPSLGFRLGVQGLTGREHYTPNFFNHSTLPYDPNTNVVSWSYFYAHADLMWRASNTFFGYSFRRVYSMTPYIHAGYQRISAPKALRTNYDQELVFGFGLLNSFRLTDRLALTIDLRETNFGARFHDYDYSGCAVRLSASVGLSVTIFQPGWQRVNEIETSRDNAIEAQKAAQSELEKALDDNDRLKKQKDELDRANDELARNNESLAGRNRELENELEAANALKAVAAEEAARAGDDELLRRIAGADLVVYYDKSVDRLRNCEEMHVDSYVQRLLQVDPLHVFYITGSADKGTGNAAINARLSNNRVNGVKQHLMTKFGIPQERIVIKGAIITDKHENACLDRCVLFENE